MECIREISTSRAAFRAQTLTFFSIDCLARFPIMGALFRRFFFTQFGFKTGQKIQRLDLIQCRISRKKVQQSQKHRTIVQGFAALILSLRIRTDLMIRKVSNFPSIAVWQPGCT